MPKPKVFVTRRLPEPALTQLESACDADIWTHELPPDGEALLQKVQGMDGLLCLLTDTIDGEVMESAGEQLKVISNCAVGFDNIVIAEATKRGIPVGNTPGILTDTTADFAFSLLMAAARRLVEADRYVRDGLWQTWGLTTLLGQDIAGAALGIVGFGRIGRAVAKRAIGFDMRVLYHDPGLDHLEEFNASPVDLDALIRESDFITIHTPLNDATYHLFNAQVFEAMKPTAILINTARGGIIDHDALYQALKEGHIAAAALDVTEPEPISPDHPLLELDNLIIAPHIASASQATRGKMAQMAVDNLLAGLAGKPLPNCVNPEVFI